MHMSDEVMTLVDNADLLHIVKYSLTMHDAFLLYAFLEQCHMDTSSFHLPSYD